MCKKYVDLRLVSRCSRVAVLNDVFANVLQLLLETVQQLFSVTNELTERQDQDVVKSVWRTAFSLRRNY